MADISTLELNGTTYNIKDVDARTAIEDLASEAADYNLDQGSCIQNANNVELSVINFKRTSADMVIDAATSSAAGVMSSADKANLDKLVANAASVGISGGGNETLYVGTSKTVSFSGSCTEFANILAIEKNGVAIATANNAKSVSAASHNFTSNSVASISFRTKAVIGAVTKFSGTFTYNFVQPCYVGCGANGAAATIKGTTTSASGNNVTGAGKLSPRTGIAGTYNVTVQSNSQHVYFIVPNNMNINKATLSGFDFPFKAVNSTTISGYKIYQSANVYDAQTLQIVIS